MDQIAFYIDEILLPMEDMVKRVRKAYEESPSDNMKQLLRRSNQDLMYFYSRFDQLLEYHHIK